MAITCLALKAEPSAANCESGIFHHPTKIENPKGSIMFTLILLIGFSCLLHGLGAAGELEEHFESK